MTCAARESANSEDKKIPRVQIFRIFLYTSRRALPSAFQLEAVPRHANPFRPISKSRTGIQAKAFDFSFRERYASCSKTVFRDDVSGDLVIKN